MKLIALFGLTGKTGTVLANKLIEKGYHIRALVRNPSKVNVFSENLTLIQGDILNQADVQETINGTSAVINVIGHVKGCHPDLQTLASNHIIKAMKTFHIRRFINLTGGGVKIEGDNPGFLDKLVLFVMKNLAGKAMKNRLKDGDDHVEVIRKTNLDWTIVRAPVILPLAEKGKTRIGMVGNIPGYSITFGDLSNAIVNILEKDLYIRQFPYITNG